MLPFIFFVVFLLVVVVVVFLFLIGNLALKTADKVKRRDEEISDLFDRLTVVERELLSVTDRQKKLSAFIRAREDGEMLQEVQGQVPYNEARPIAGE